MCLVIGYEQLDLLVKVEGNQVESSCDRFTTVVSLHLLNAVESCPLQYYQLKLQ